GRRRRAGVRTGRGLRVRAGRRVGGGAVSRTASRWRACGLAVVSFAFVGVFAWLQVVHHQTLGSRGLYFAGSDALFGIAVPAVGALLASRKAENPIGWLMLVIGVSFAADSAAHAYSQYWLRASGTILASAQWVAWAGTWLWVLGWALTFTLLLL